MPAKPQRTKLEEGIRKVITPLGKVSYEVRGQNNKQKHVSISKRETTLERARALRNKFAAEETMPAEPPRYTVADAVDYYLETHADVLPSNALGNFAQVKKTLGDRSIAHLDKSAVKDWAKSLRKLRKTKSKLVGGKLVKVKTSEPYAEASLRKFYFALKLSVLLHATDKQYPFDGEIFTFKGRLETIVPQAWTKPRERLLEEGEEERLYNVDLRFKTGDYKRIEDWQNLIGFALETCMRLQEIIKAEWTHLSREGFNLAIPAINVKTKDKRTIALTPRAREIIRSQLEGKPENAKRIFYQWTTPRSAGDGFRNLTEMAGIEDLTFHSLRHEAITRLCATKLFTLYEAMRLTGHTSEKTFSKYDHFFVKDENRFGEIKSLKEGITTVSQTGQ